MGQLPSIFLGLLTTLIGYLIGRVWQKVVDQMPYRQAKEFWRPMLDGGLQVIVSRFISDAFSDLIGLVGGGDALAMREISSFFAEIGFKDVDVVYVDEASVDREKNLILLGGPDTNVVTKDALAIIRPQLRIFDPGPGNPMEIHDLAPSSVNRDGKRGGRTHHKYIAKPDTDYGVIIRARNPFNPGKLLVVLAGAYGYGSWAAAKLALENGFAEECSQLDSRAAETRFSSLGKILRKYFKWKYIITRSGNRNNLNQLECLFSVRVFDEQPHAPEILVLRTLP